MSAMNTESDGRETLVCTEAGPGQALAVPMGPVSAPSRRRVLGVVGGMGALALLGCGGGIEVGGSGSGSTGSGSSDSGTTGGGSGGSTDTGATDTGTSDTGGTCREVPSETNGPYPADGTNGYNVLALAGIVRQDIRSSIGGGDVQPGAPLTLKVHLTGTKSSCGDLSGYAVYIWHCTAAGDYSVYTENSVSRNYLRGVQATGEDGVVEFITVMPGCYMGRMPHIHVEVYPSLATATHEAKAIKTTQFAFPSKVMSALYGTQAAYSDSIRPFNSISFASDNVFSDGYEDEMLRISGDSANGYVGEITISVAA